MFKQVSKQLLCLLCAVICTCALSSPCMAADISSIEDGVIELRMTNINDAQCAISVKNGTAAASANVGGKRGAEKCKIVLKIQEQQGSRWVTLIRGRSKKMDATLRLTDRSMQRAVKPIGHRLRLQFGLMAKQKARPLQLQVRQHNS